MAQQCPLRCLEECVVLDIGCAATRSETLGFVFDEQFADDVFAEAVTCQYLVNSVKGNRRTLIFVERLNLQGRALHLSGCWQM